MKKYSTEQKRTIFKLVVFLLDEKYLPSAVRPCSDVFSENGQMFAMTVDCGSYQAILIKGRVVAVKF